jgi:glutamate decarboxylase
MNATAGTTVMGGFDPFEEIAAICKKNNIWFHVDGCWVINFIIKYLGRDMSIL